MTKFKIGKSYLELTIGDITIQDTDSVVNAANKMLAPGGGVAGAIHRAAGPKLWEECKKLGGCHTGEAKITKGYDLPSPYIIHTVGPVYSGSSDNPIKLASCYRESMRLARENQLTSVSFPALSTGFFGYPIHEATNIALRTVVDELKKGPEIKLVRFVLYDERALEVHEKALDLIKIY
jgi:O-acetyl-ADP-ribose deacetylase (regulator of RNase III)